MDKKEKLGNFNVKGRAFAFTDYNQDNINNGYNDIYNANSKQIRAIIWGKETCPKTGNIHNQGQIQFFNQQMGSWWQKKIKSNCHMELTANLEESIKYCMKDNEWTLLGSFSKGQGQRSDLNELCERLINGEDKKTVKYSNPGLWCRYSKGLNSLAEEAEDETLQMSLRSDLYTIVYIGRSGTGKTHKVYEDSKGERVFVVDLANESFPFNGYNGEKIILLDEFNGQLKYDHLLKVLDKWPLPVNVKGGRKYAQWTKVYITSNAPPHKWYERIYENLNRRLTEVHEVLGMGNTIPYRVGSMKDEGYSSKRTS